MGDPCGNALPLHPARGRGEGEPGGSGSLRLAHCAGRGWRPAGTAIDFAAALAGPAAASPPARCSPRSHTGARWSAASRAEPRRSSWRRRARCSSPGKEEVPAAGRGLAREPQKREFYSYSSNYFYALVFHWEPQATVSRTCNPLGSNTGSSALLLRTPDLYSQSGGCVAITMATGTSCAPTVRHPGARRISPCPRPRVVRGLGAHGARAAEPEFTPRPCDIACLPGPASPAPSQAGGAQEGCGALTGGAQDTRLAPADGACPTSGTGSSTRPGAQLCTVTSCHRVPNGSPN